MTVQVRRDEPTPVEAASRNIFTQLWERATRREKVGPLAKRRERWFYLMISPWIVGFVLFQIGPIIGAGALSFAEYSLTRGASWVGLRHYQSMLSDRVFTKTLGNTAYYTLVSVPLNLIVAFALACLLNQKIRGVTIFRTIFFLPAVVQGVAVFLLWGWIFNPRFGLLNSILEWFGITGPGWLQSETWAMPAIIIISLWSIGWIMLIYLAGLQDIPQELYEASEIDGASRWQQFRFITIPLISPVTFFLFVTGTIFAMQVFVPLFVLTRGGPNSATMTLSLLIYLSAFGYNKLGYASAIALVLFLIILLITLVQFGGAKRWVYYASEVE